MSEDRILASCDRKVRAYNSQKNTFGLLPGPKETCPNATTEKGGCWYIAPGKKLPTCYVTSTMQVYKNVARILEHNTAILKTATQAEMSKILNAEFQRFRTTELRRKKRGLSMTLHYRLHWSGDIFNTAYAKALADSIQFNNDITFWCYTRSFFSVPILCNIDNLILYLSLDPVNIQAGLTTYTDNKTSTNNLSIAYMNNTDDFPSYLNDVLKISKGRNMIRQLLTSPLKFLRINDIDSLQPCPVDLKNIPLDGGCRHCKQWQKAVPVFFKT